MTAASYHTMLTIAGSDPSGGAGIQADIKTASALGVYAMSVITAVTAQNTCGVTGFEAVSLPMLRSQLTAVLSDIRPGAVKIGMIPSAAHVRVIAEAIGEYDLKHVVLDPVLVATSGDALSEGDTVQTLLHSLAPHAEIITPNIPEAEALTSIKITDLHSCIGCADGLLGFSGAKSVLLKGGHGADPGEIIDIFIDADHKSLLTHRRIDTPNTHGTGCTLSSAIASLLALGYDRHAAVVRGVEWLGAAIEAGANKSIGHGQGPVNHLFKIPEYND